MTLLKAIVVFGLPFNAVMFFQGIAKQQPPWVIALSGVAAIACLYATLYWVYSAE